MNQRCVGAAEQIYSDDGRPNLSAFRGYSGKASGAGLSERNTVLSETKGVTGMDGSNVTANAGRNS